MEAAQHLTHYLEDCISLAEVQKIERYNLGHLV